MKVMVFEGRESNLYSIRFWHEHYWPDCEEPYSDATFCKIEDCDGNVVAVGNSRCSKQDRFVRAIGRQIALARALGEAGFSRDMSRQVYQKYLSTIKRDPNGDHWDDLWTYYSQQRISSKLSVTLPEPLVDDDFQF